MELQTSDDNVKHWSHHLQMGFMERLPSGASRHDAPQRQGLEGLPHPNPVDFRKSIDGLAALAEMEIKVAVFDPVLFVFINRDAASPANKVPRVMPVDVDMHLGLLPLRIDVRPLRQRAQGRAVKGFKSRLPGTR